MCMACGERDRDCVCESRVVAQLEAMRKLAGKYRDQVKELEEQMVVMRELAAGFIHYFNQLTGIRSWLELAISNPGAIMGKPWPNTPLACYEQVLQQVEDGIRRGPAEPRAKLVELMERKR